MRQRAEKLNYRPFPNIERRNITQEYLEVPAMVAAMKIRPGLRMLEVGCGRGVALPPLAKRCRPNALVGIDIDPDFVTLAQRRIEGRGIRATVRVADVRDLPFEAGCFDVVIDFGTCYHISDSQRALSEIERVLAPGGRFISETRFGQILSHPIRSRTLTIPWDSCPGLESESHRLIWLSRRKAG